MTPFGMPGFSGSWPTSTSPLIFSVGSLPTSSPGQHTFVCAQRRPPATWTWVFLKVLLSQPFSSLSTSTTFSQSYIHFLMPLPKHSLMTSSVGGSKHFNLPRRPSAQESVKSFRLGLRNGKWCSIQPSANSFALVASPLLLLGLCSMGYHWIMSLISDTWAFGLTRP